MSTTLDTYRIIQTATGVTLWEGKAESKAAALDTMAREAGYPDYEAIPGEAGGADSLDVIRIDEAQTVLERTAKYTARVFADEFPGEEPDPRWLAEAASIDGIPDNQREAYFELVTKQVKTQNGGPA